MRTRWARRQASLATALLLAIPTTARAVATPVIAHESGIWGGGFINALARDPAPGSSRFVIGGDTSGLHTTGNAGDFWTTNGAGLNDLAQDTIVAVAYRQPPNDNQIFAAYGEGIAGSSGILKGRNGGVGWRKVVPVGTTLPVFQGHSPGGAAAYQVGAAPRATGALLALDEAAGTLKHVYAGTFGDGVMRSDDGGVTWTRIALGGDGSNPDCMFQTGGGTSHGCFVTSLVLSEIPGEVDTLYASVHGGDASKCVGNGVCGGVFKITNAGCSGNGCADPTTARLDATPQPANAEELAFTGQTLLCACGTDGFYEKSVGDPGLVQRNSNLVFDSSIGTSYAAIAASQGIVLLGAYNPECEMVGQRQTCHTVYQSTDVGVTWTDLTFDILIENIDLTVSGTDVPWWEGSHKDSLIDGQQFTVSSIGLTDDVPPVVLVAGHSGVWKTTDPDHQHWQPAVQGIGATTNNDVIADPRYPGYVYVGNTDWVAFASSSNLDPGKVVQTETPTSESPRKTTGFAVALDEQDLSSPSDVYLAAGIHGPSAQDINVGGVYVNPDPTMDAWESEGFTADQTCEGRSTPRVIGVAVGRVSGSDDPDVYAATDGCGLYRLRDGTWTHIATSTDLFATEDFLFNYAPLSYPNSLGGVLYALDRKTGELWRSQNGGTTWGQGPIFTIPAGELDFNSGFTVADPNSRLISVVWVSTNASNGLHQLTCVTQCEVAANWIDRTDFAEVSNPGPIAIASCFQPCATVVYVATRAVAGDPTPARLYKSTPSGGFCGVVSGVSFYRGAANFPAQLAVTPSVSGTVTAYLSTIGDGTIVISDPTGPDCT